MLADNLTNKVTIVSDLFNRNKFIIFCNFILLSINLFAMQDIEIPKEPIVVQIQQSVSNLGKVAISILLILSILKIILRSSYLSPTAKVDIIFESIFYANLYFAIYALFLIIIGGNGDGIYRALISQNIVAVCSSVVVVLFMLASCIVVKGMFTLQMYSGMKETIEIKGNTSMFPTHENAAVRSCAAARETGQVMVYAALQTLPADLIINLPETRLQYLYRSHTNHLQNDKTLAEWRLLSLLAGEAGEQFASLYLNVEKQHHSDLNLRWINLAREYLSDHSGNTSASELNFLQEYHQQLLSTLFLNNTEVFKGLYTTLLNRKTVYTEELIPFIKKINLPESFPRPVNKE